MRFCGGPTTWETVLRLSKSAEFVAPSFLAKATSWKVSRGVPEALRSDVEKIKARLESGSS